MLHLILRCLPNTQCYEQEQRANLARLGYKHGKIPGLCIHAASMTVDEDTSAIPPPTARQIGCAITIVVDKR